MYDKKAVDKYYKKNKDNILKHKKKQYPYIKKKQLEYRYNLTGDDYNKLLLDQENKCWICRLPFTDVSPAYVDHSHQKGHVRGLLCRLCNVGLGSFKDSIDSLQTAIKYLQEKEL